MTKHENGDESITDASAPLSETAAASAQDPVGDDSEAFSWAGDESQSLAHRISELSDDAGEARVREASDAVPSDVLSNLEQVVQPAPVEVPVATQQSEPEPKREPLSNVALVFVGLLAGVYILYSIGWFLGARRLEDARGTLISGIGFEVAFWLSVALPALWFVASMLATKKTWTRLTALFVGALLCIPWPFVMTGTWGL